MGIDEEFNFTLRGGTIWVLLSVKWLQSLGFLYSNHLRASMTKSTWAGTALCCLPALIWLTVIFFYVT
jgi:hypothetical protein